MSAAEASVVDRVARESYGRLVAYLSTRSNDVSAAEDALGDAFRVALESWPRDGVPARPEAWLLTAARRKLLDRARHGRVAAAALPDLIALTDGAVAVASGEVIFPDDRLRLMFVCAHPAISPAMHTPLMLQTVLGLDAARIGAAFLVSPKSMGQRLTRAKLKIKAAGIAFEVPEHPRLPERLEAVLDAIYAAYCSGWHDIADIDVGPEGLAHQAIALARMLNQLMPEQPETMGLLALMLHCEARREARREGDRYIPLDRQDTRRWETTMIGEAEALLIGAAKPGQIGRYQLEAAIQSVHAQRAVTGETDWRAVLLLYEGLVQAAPSTGALVGRAGAAANVDGPEAGMRLLDEIAAERIRAYQPYFALRADLLHRLGRSAEARGAYDRARGLASDPAVRNFLAARSRSINEPEVLSWPTQATPSRSPALRRRSMPSSRTD